MSNSTLKNTFVTDDRQITAAYEKLLRNQQRLLDASVAIATESRKQSKAATGGLDDQTAASRRLSSGLDDVVGSLGRMAAGYASIQGAVNLANKEIQQHIKLQLEASNAQQGMAKPRADLLQNLGNISPAELKKVQAGIDKLAVQGLGSRETLTSAYGALVSASPNLTNEKRLETMQVATQFSPQPENVEATAAGLADMSKVTGSDNPMENLGVLQSAQSKSRIIRAPALLKNVIPAAINIRQFGDSPEEALALPLALGNAVNDASGEQTRTASQQGAGQLHEFFSDEAIRGRALKGLQREASLGDFDKQDNALRESFGEFMRSHGSKATAYKDQFEAFKKDQALQDEYFANYLKQHGAAADNTRQRIEYLQQHPEDREAFLKGFHAEETFKIPWQNLVSAQQGEISQQYTQFANEDLVSGKAAEALGRQAIANIQADPNIAQQRMARGLEASKNILLSGNQRAADAGTLRKNLGELLDASGVSWTDKKIQQLMYDVKTGLGSHDTFDEFKSQMDLRAEALQQQALYRPATLSEQFGGELPPGTTKEDLSHGLVRRDEADVDAEKLRQAEVIRATVANVQREAMLRRQAAQSQPEVDVSKIKQLPSNKQPPAPDEANQPRPAVPIGGEALPAESGQGQASPPGMEESKSDWQQGMEGVPREEARSKAGDGGSEISLAGPQVNAAALRRVAAGRSVQADGGADVRQWGEIIVGRAAPAQQERFQDELALLKKGPEALSPADLVGHSGDIEALYDETYHRRQMYRQPGAVGPDGSPTGAVAMPQTADDKRLEAVMTQMLDVLKQMHSAAEKAEKAQTAMAQAQQTANRQNGARASRARGRE